MLFGPDDLWKSNDGIIKQISFLSVGVTKNVLYLFWIGSLYNVWISLDFVEGGLAKVFGEIKNWCRWSEMVAVILPQIMSLEMTLLKILSTRVLEWLVCRLDWMIYGK